MHWSEDLFVGVVITLGLFIYLTKNMHLETLSFKGLVIYSLATFFLGNATIELGPVLLVFFIFFIHTNHSFDDFKGT